MKKVIFVLFLVFVITGCTHNKLKIENPTGEVFQASDDMKECETEKDCSSVGCGDEKCEDVVNKMEKSNWYGKRKCPPSEGICLPFENVKCENNMCVIGK